MDDFPDRHAYRCLPLSIANAHGWDMLCPAAIEIEWDGGQAAECLTVRGLQPLPGGRPVSDFCRTNFTCGIVTFHTDYVFRTENDWDLLATGPFNSPKPGIYPLTGIMESNWLPYPFTMNWQLTKPGRIVFEKDEPFCFIFPVRKQAVLDCQPEIHDIREDPELARQHDAFAISRNDFMKRFNAREPEALKNPWLKFYFTGRHPDGVAVDNHVNKLRVASPVDKRCSGATGLKVPETVVVDPPQVVSRWKSGSPLNTIANQQTRLNELGRARIAGDGQLHYRDGVKHPTTFDDQNCVVEEKFLSDPICDALCEVFRELSTTIVNHVDGYWDSRFIWYSDVVKDHPELAGHMLEAQRSASALITAFYQLNAAIYPDLLQIMSWPVGIHMPPHADNANPDGSRHAMAYRDFSGIIYLNDDFQGGEFYFTAHNTVIKPKKGMLVAFTAGFYHEHAVLRVAGTPRLTMPFFLTFDKDRADPSLL
jgi:hypothetical protein